MITYKLDLLLLVFLHLEEKNLEIYLFPKKKKYHNSFLAFRDLGTYKYISKKNITLKK